MEPKNQPTSIMHRKFGCLGILIPLLLLVFGIDNMNYYAADSAVAARYPVPVTLTYEEFSRRRPAEGWFHITGGILDLASARATRIGSGQTVEENGTVISVEAPLRSATKSGTKPPYVSVFSFDNKLCQAWKHIDDVAKGEADDGPTDKAPTPQSRAEKKAREAERVRKYIAMHPEKVFPT